MEIVTKQISDNVVSVSFKEDTALKKNPVPETPGHIWVAVPFSYNKADRPMYLVDAETKKQASDKLLTKVPLFDWTNYWLMSAEELFESGRNHDGIIRL